jgi:hypothetical protein
MNYMNKSLQVQKSNIMSPKLNEMNSNFFSDENLAHDYLFKRKEIESKYKIINEKDEKTLVKRKILLQVIHL